VHVVVSQLKAVHYEAALTVPVRAHDLCGRGPVKPFRAEDRGC
jgi:hypothetical protein